MNRKILILILIVVSLPLIQAEFRLFRVSPLNGYYTFTEKPKLSFASLSSGLFQAEYMKYTEDSVPLKPWMVRINNQLDFSLFDLSNAKNTVVGKNGILYEKTYIDSYFGNDFTGEKEIRRKIDHLVRLQQVLQEQGKYFLVIFEPGKARFMPENIPDQLLKKTRSVSNYEIYRKLLSEEKIPLHIIDFNRYFCEERSSSKAPLYPDLGTHWSVYGALGIVADSIIHSMESISGRRIPDIQISKLEWSEIPRDPDDDIYKGLNLLADKTSSPLAYPVWEVRDKPGAWKPKVLMISDSYYWVMYNSKIFTGSFESGDFWFYYDRRYPEAKYKTINDPAALRADILSHDFVILMMTEIFLPKMFEAPEKMLQLLDQNNPEIQALRAQKEKRILEIETLIRNNPEWMGMIRIKAKASGKTLDQQIRADAEYVSQHE